MEMENEKVVKNICFQSNLEKVFEPIEKVNQEIIDSIVAAKTSYENGLDDSLTCLTTKLEKQKKEEIQNSEIISKKLKKIKTSLSDTVNQKEVLDNITDMLASLLSTYKAKENLPIRNENDKSEEKYTNMDTNTKKSTEEESLKKQSEDKKK